MLPIKLQQNGGIVLRQYCLNRKFEVVEKGSEMFYVRAPNKNWFNKKCKLGVLFTAIFDEDEKTFYIYFKERNFGYELVFEELLDLFNFIEKIRDKKEAFKSGALFN